MRIRYSLLVIGYGLLVICAGGCAALTEGAKCAAGISTKVLQDNRKTAIVETVNLDYFTAYAKTCDFLKQSGSCIYAQGIDKHMIAVYLSQTDTTPVGIFFTETAANATQIEVVSPSSHAKSLIAEKLFSVLKKEGA